MNKTRKILTNANKEDIVAQCLIFTTNEEYETKLCKTHHQFHAFNHKDLKGWDTKEYAIPENYTVLKYNELPTWIDFSAIIVQNKIFQYNIAKNIRDALHIPIIAVERSKPSTNPAIQQEVTFMKNCIGDINVFTSEEHAELWGIDHRTIVITENNEEQFVAQWETILEQICEE